MNKAYRVLDSNFNRVSEGIRVIEDYSRFQLDDEELTQSLREVRKKTRKISSDLDDELLSARNSEFDVGKEISKNSKSDSRKDDKQMLVSNFKRAEEGLRSIEENLKTIDQYEKSKKIEKLRFDIYTLEKNVIPEVNDKPELPEGIYGITAEKYSKGRSNVEVVKEMIKGGVSVVQYREKHDRKDFQEMYKECKQIRTLTRKNDIIFIVNDYLELARMCNADGVHTGQKDFPADEVKQIMPSDTIVGVSTHSREQAKKAIKQGADYIGVGPIYETNTKEDVCDPVGHEYLKWAVENVDIPFVAIGGIKEHNIDEVIDIGAKSISLVTEIVSASDISGKVENLVKILKKRR